MICLFIGFISDTLWKALIEQKIAELSQEWLKLFGTVQWVQFESNSWYNIDTLSYVHFSLILNVLYNMSFTFNILCEKFF